jgi:hypothetical protein
MVIKDGDYNVEGYWRSDKNEKSVFPWPEISNEIWDKESFLLKLGKVERISTCRYYKGWSTSRLTGESIGSKEYYYKNWKWPEGLRHYIHHGVKPSQEFIDFITNAC